MENTSQDNSKTQTALSRAGQRGMAMIQALADISPESLEKFSRRMPARIQDAIELPMVCEMVRESGEKNVLAYLEFELIKLSTLVSVGGNLNDSQVPFIAKELIRIYPNENLADFKLCFQRGAIGQYGQILRMDGIVLRDWMQKYLEEKYTVAKNKLMDEKDDLYRQVNISEEDREAKNKQIKKRLREWETEINKIASDKSEPRMPAEQTAKEGAEWKSDLERKAIKYSNGITPEQYELKRKLQRAASELYKGRTSFSLKSFERDGVEFMAESEEDALEIYRIATNL